jgi:hypothetical protein
MKNYLGGYEGRGLAGGEKSEIKTAEGRDSHAERSHIVALELERSSAALPSQHWTGGQFCNDRQLAMMPLFAARVLVTDRGLRKVPLSCPRRVPPCHNYARVEGLALGIDCGSRERAF